MFFQREWVTREELESRLELYEESGAGDVCEVNYEELQQARAYEDGRFERLSAVGLSLILTKNLPESPEKTCMKFYTTGKTTCTS